MYNIIAHRGFSSRKVENTEEAIELAFSKDYIDEIEVDVRMTKDQKLVLVHDDSVVKKGNKKTYINKSNYEDLVLKPIARGQKFFKKFLFFLNSKRILKKNGYIPLLENVVSLLPEDKNLLLDLKGEKDEIYLKELIKIIKKHQNKNIKIQSTDKEVLNQLKVKLPDIKIGLILKNMKDYDNNFDFYSINKKIVESSKIKELLKEKKEIKIWTVNSYADFLILKRELGKNMKKVFLITDYPDVMYFLKKFNK